MSEDRLERLERAIEEIYRLCRSSSSETGDIKIAVARLEERQRLAASCPSPGACTQMKADIKTLQEDVDGLKESRTFLKGHWAAFLLIASVLTSALALYSNFKKSEAAASYAAPQATPAGSRP